VGVREPGAHCVHRLPVGRGLGHKVRCWTPHTQTLACVSFAPRLPAQPDLCPTSVSKPFRPSQTGEPAAPTAGLPGERGAELLAQALDGAAAAGDLRAAGRVPLVRLPLLARTMHALLRHSAPAGASQATAAIATPQTNFLTSSHPPRCTYRRLQPHEEMQRLGAHCRAAHQPTLCP